jgi:hypothetical protein
MGGSKIQAVPDFNFLFRPLIDPVVEGFVPEAGVLGLEDPVAFVGEIEHL